MKQYITLNDRAYAHVLATGVREHESLKALRHETYAQMPDTNMPVSVDQGQFLQWMVGTLGVQRILEVGCFTGYSALAMALALPDDGQLITCDVSGEWTQVGAPFWQQAGVADKIDLRIAPALETLESLQHQEASFDLMFIDADKQNYDQYYEIGLQLVRPGGVMILDNVIALRELNVDSDKPGAQALCALNQQIHDDSRVAISTVSVGGGMTLCRVL